MDRMKSLVANWMENVTNNDTILIVGDIGSNCSYTWKILRSLSGSKVLVVGNHDNLIEWPNEALSIFDDIQFYIVHEDTLCIHKPQDRRLITQPYKWCVHAHHHTVNAIKLAGDIDNYINDSCRFNCSVDLNDQSPQTLQRLMYKKACLCDEILTK